MKELVGECHICSEKIYCLDGFLNGTVNEEGKLRCFACSMDNKENQESLNEGE